MKSRLADYLTVAGDFARKILTAAPVAYSPFGSGLWLGRSALFVITASMLVFDSQARAAADALLPGWKFSGDFTVLTTPEGANLPANVAVEEFPLLVRLNRDWFDFSKAKPEGADVRFTTSDGKLLAHQIEEWDEGAGAASVWVRVPRIKGNDRLTLRMHWGNSNAATTSDGKAVFNESNGYLSVWHLGETVSDDAGALESKQEGTTATPGVIGKARHFTEGAKITCGDKIPGYPTGNAPHTTELWFRPSRSNVSLIGWGAQSQQGKVVMQFRGPPHVSMDCWFSDGNVKSEGLIAVNEWNQAVFAYESGNARLYINGALAGKAGRGTPLNIKSPARLSIGGWSGDFNYAGDLDEVRVSRVTRSAEWVRLQYENQKPMQTLVGPVMRSEEEFAVVPERLTVAEGGTVRVVARTGGAQKIYWSLASSGREEMLAVDRHTLEFAAPRVVGDTTMTLRLKAVDANGVKARDIPVLVKEAMPDPEFTLIAPEKWDGRHEIEVVPRVTNLPAMRKAGAGELQMSWNAGPFAVIKEVEPGKLRLLGAQNSGALGVTATLSNGGVPVTRAVTIQVAEPKADPWVERVPGRDEKPEEGQFYARDERNEGSLHYTGTLREPSDEVFLRIFSDDQLFATVKAKPGTNQSYALAAKLKAGLVKYRVEFGTLAGGKETVLERVGDLVCGDAFLIDGQSNALATDTREESPAVTNEWIRSYGRAPVNSKDLEGNLWCRPVWKARKGEKAELGWWGMELAKRLLESQKVPIFIINGAVGGTRIDQHARNASDPADVSTIYGRMLWRAQHAKITHGIRGILWHQGENDQGADAPSGDYGSKNYQAYFTEMAAGWRRDFPNARHYFVFQIWPNSCGMGGKDGAGDRLREAQRGLPRLFSNLSILSTLGIHPPGGCHYPLAGWSEFARLVHPVIERDVYGNSSKAPITAPNLQTAVLTAPDTLALRFDQPVKWNDALATQFYLDGQSDKIASGSVAGAVLTLKLRGAGNVKNITYLKEAKWSQDNLLWGENGIAALTFCEVPVGTAAANRTP